MLFASWVLEALLTMNLLVYPTVGQTVCFHTRDSDSLLVTRTLGLPSNYNHISPALYSRCLRKLLYNMNLLPSNAHSNVINQHCRTHPALCCALIVLLLMISRNVHVHPGPSTVARAQVRFGAICFTDLAYYLKWINWKCGFTAPIQMLDITETWLRKSFEHWC